MRPRVLRIGIATREHIQARTLAIARGDYKPRPDEPKVWFTSMESLAQVLSTKNKLLLELIATAKPASIKQLSLISGREMSNLSRTITTMERYGLVHVRVEGKRRIPETCYDNIELDIPLRDAFSTIRNSNNAKLELVS